MRVVPRVPPRVSTRIHTGVFHKVFVVLPVHGGFHTKTPFLLVIFRVSIQKENPGFMRDIAEVVQGISPKAFLK